MTKENGVVRWSWLGPTVIGALAIVAFFLYTDTRADIKKLQEKKADQEDVARIEKKVDKVFDYLVEHREQTEGLRR